MNFKKPKYDTFIDTIYMTMTFNCLKKKKKKKVGDIYVKRRIRTLVNKFHLYNKSYLQEQDYTHVEETKKIL